MKEIRGIRRAKLSKQEIFQLEVEDMKEESELRRYIAQQLVDEFCEIDAAHPRDTSRKSSSNDHDISKASEGRQSGSAEWVRARGECPFEGL